MTGVAYFEPGEGVALVGNGFALLTPAGRDDDFVYAMADLVDLANPSPDDLAARLVSRDLRTLPAFVLAIASPDDLRVLARGVIDVVIAEGADLVPVNGRNAHTWLERSFDPGSTLHASCNGPELRGRYAFTFGLVPARTLQWSPTVDVAVEPHVPVHAAVPPLDRSPLPADERAPDVRISQDSLAPAVAAAPPPFAPLPSVAPARSPDHGGDGDVDDLTSPADREAAAEVEPVLDRADRIDDLSVHTLVPPANHEFDDQADRDDADRDDAEAIDAAADSPSATGPTPDKDHLFGATRNTSVDLAAVRVEEDDGPEGPESSRGPELIEALAAPQPERAPATPSGPPSSPPNSGLIDSVPWATDLPGASARNHDGRTRSIDQFVTDAALEASSDRAPDGPHYDGPLVQAAVCPAGHPNPPSASVCWACSSALSSDRLATVHRPPLGALVIDGGRRVVLDRTVVLGRQPSADGSFPGEPPLLLTVGSTSGDVSRTHAEVRVEGWNVRVVDLSSTNGTVVQTPGRAPERLRPHQPVAFVPNSTVRLAKEVTITFEAPS